MGCIGLRPGAFFKASLLALRRGNPSGPVRHHCNPGCGMAHLFRLIVCVLLLASGSAFAVSSQSGWLWFSGNNPADGVAYTSHQAACVAAEATFPQTVPEGFALQGYHGQGALDGGGLYPCLWKRLDVAYGNIETTQAHAAAQGSGCPPNSSLVNGVCQCKTGYQQNTGGTACEVPPPPKNKCEKLAGTSAGDYSHDSGVNEAGNAPLYGDFSLSVDGCKVEVSNPTCAKNNALGGGWFICTGRAVYSGAECSTAAACTSNKPFGNPAAPPTPPEPNPSPDPADPDAPTPKPEEPRQAPCPAGQSPGQVNGTTVCAQSGPEGSAGTSEASVKNPDGSGTTTNSTTKCTTGSKCTTDTTTCTQIAGGSNGSCSTTTTTGTIQGVCSKDPGNSVCVAGAGGSGTPSAFGGDCAAGFKAVSDDAVINAMAEETFRQNCKVNPDTDSQALAKAEALKTGNQTGDNPNNGSVTVGPGNFDTTDAIGGGSACIADKSVSVMGSSFLLPFSRVCGSLEALGMVLLACSFLLAARIVTRG